MFKIVFTLISLLLMPLAAEAAGSVDSGDTAWILASTALVMLIVPGIGLFYGGMVRRKNILGTMIQSFAILSIVSVVWVMWGYTLAFGPDIGGVIGSVEWFGLNGIDGEAARRAPSVPHLIFVMYQGMFAAITPVIMAGALAERIRFSALLGFTVLWVTVVYAPVCHWMWGGGIFGEIMGALDFGGGVVVHISAAVSAAAALKIIGKRRGYGVSAMPPNNLPMTLFGAGLMWFGWFGFTAGNAGASGGVAAAALVSTNTAAAAAAMAWLFIEWRHLGRPTALGIVSGAVTGLVAISPAAGYVTPVVSIIIGAAAGLLCYAAVALKQRLGVDDSLDVIGIHGVGGTWGTLAAGLFASQAINPLGANGVFYGNPPLLAIQVIAVTGVYVFVFAASFVIFKVIDMTIGLRVDEEMEYTGLDKSQHGESVV
ncbi:ammonium transporter [Candidatus Magnetominusculus xianensis]|uniref:Ammonium transporter n=1 Tax=Candidatus Magnetominusculus xianensis TaxID=1748249 RepID=A0ABR5SD42_9BACT|nr:ammonium transporter [Candidatus Magnetominusculus xianensis]KWT82653.1 ammonia channel protein [Candidatus Magnetominusculus xianensis]MBF0405336.1 ammonium transporter [Nitrospirota bacterium]